MRFLLSIITVLIASPLWAQTMSAAEFEARMTGKTMSFARSGQPFGVEQYLPGRRVIWSFVDDVCQMGRWYEEAGKICFRYDMNPEPQCWDFFDRDGQISARYVGDTPENDLFVVGETDKPIQCPLPGLGA